MARSLNWMIAGLLIIPVAAQAQVKPGQWETTVKAKSMEMPGASPQMAEMMKRSMGRGQTHTISHCVTPEDAAKGPREMVKENPSCRVNNFSMSGGHYSADMTCSQNGETTNVRSSGTISPTAYSATSTMTMKGRMSMTATNEVSGRWVGPCKGK